MSRGATTMPREDLAKAQLRAVVIGAEQGAGQSAQPAEDQWTPNEGLRPPLDLDALAALTSTSRLRRSCIAAITLNTVGLGYSLAPVEGAESEGDQDDPAEVATRLDALARRDRRLGRPNLTRLLQAAKWDEQEVGNGYVEVSRNRVSGEIDGLYHVPGKRIRRRGDRKGWVMGPKGGRGLDLTHFYDFGEKVEYDEAGRPQPRLAAGASRWDRNELITFQLYTSASRDYGLPPDYQLANDYLGDKLAGKANVGFFDNSGVAPTVIFVAGRESTDGTGAIEVDIDPQMIESIVATLKTGGAASQVALVPIPAGSEVTSVDLATRSERDLGFVGYRSDNRRATLGAFRLSPIFVADIEDAGKYTAEVERAITKEQLFDPEQRRWQDILDQTILRELASHLALDFAEIAIKGDEAKRMSANDLASYGRITNIEYREAHGYPPLAEADERAEDLEPGQVPHGWNAALMDTPPPAAPAEDEIEKAARGALARGVEDDLASAIDDAVRAVSTMADDAELRPVVVERLDDGRVTVSPFAANGAGP